MTIEDEVSAEGGITCREFVEFLASYVAWELAIEDREAFNAHLAACSSCLAYMKSYKQAVRLGRAVLCESDQVKEEVPEELVRLILASHRKE